MVTEEKIKPQKIYAVIVAGGKGLRMGSQVKKQYLKIKNTPVLSKTLKQFDRCGFIDEITLVVPKNDISFCKEQIINPFAYTTQISLIKGGVQRQDSVLNGLNHIRKINNVQDDSIVLIHDGVRPFVSRTLISSCVQAALKYGACVPGIKIADTVKQANIHGLVDKTLDREFLYAIQTPQAFRLSTLIESYEHALNTGYLGSDDASLVENCGKSIHIVEGNKRNIKITTPEDLVLAGYLSDHD